MILRPAAWPACLAAAVLVSACGSGPGDGSDGSGATRPAVVSARVDEPRAAGAGGRPCAAGQEAPARAYAVADVPSDDPDGGLVLLDAPGAGGAQRAILPGGAPVTALDGPAACAVVAGVAWWRIRSGDGVRGWVDSGSLRRRG